MKFPQAAKTSLPAGLALTALISSPLAIAEYEISTRVNIVGSSGKPTNDVLGVGISLHQRLDDDWYIGYNLDHSAKFDFERPYD